MNRHNWTSEEDAQLREVVDKNGSEDWTKNAQLLRQISTTADQKKRTGKQCRERWYNHLDPTVVKSQWKIQQQSKLFQMHKAHGNKWKQLTKYLPGRTDNDIKNHFYSTLRRSLRRLNKYSGQKNSTSQMREIKPSVLTFIINHIYSHDAKSSENKNLINSLKQLPQLIFKFSNFKPVKQNMDRKIDENMKQRISIIMRLVQQFKQLYRKQKNEDIENSQPQKKTKSKLQNYQTIGLKIQGNNSGDEDSNYAEESNKYAQNEHDNNTSQLKHQINSQEVEMPDIVNLEQVWMNNNKTKIKQNREFVPIVTIQRKASGNDSKQISKKLILMPKTEERLEQKQRIQDVGHIRSLSFYQEQDLNDGLMPIEEPSVSLNENSNFFNDLVVIGKHIEPIQCLATNEHQNFVQIDEILYENYQD